MSQKQGFAMVAVIVVVLTTVTAAASLTGRWVFTAIPIGVLFGFFLQKGDLCGASAFSEVVLARDWRKVWGLWVGIVVSMAGIASTFSSNGCSTSGGTPCGGTPSLCCS